MNAAKRKGWENAFRGIVYNELAGESAPVLCRTRWYSTPAAAESAGRDLAKRRGYLLGEQNGPYAVSVEIV
jgi:hypothetical protein